MSRPNCSKLYQKYFLLWLESRACPIFQAVEIVMKATNGIQTLFKGWGLGGWDTLLLDTRQWKPPSTPRARSLLIFLTCFFVIHRGGGTTTTTCGTTTCGTTTYLCVCHCFYVISLGHTWWLFRLGLDCRDFFLTQFPWDFLLLFIMTLESIKWDLKTRPIYECQRHERLKTKGEECTRLSCIHWVARGGSSVL